MADRNRKPVEESKLDLDKSFLEKSRVKETMSDMVTQLSANRPKDPLQFMADYFQSTFEQSNRLDKCYRCIMMTHHSRPVYKQNLVTAFDILNQTKLGKYLHGVNGLVFDELLTLILQDTPEGCIGKIRQKLSRRHYEAITYDMFHYAVTVLAVYKDYLEMAEHLFELLDVKSTGQVDQVYSEILLNQLKTTFTHLSENLDSDIQAGISLSPEALYAVLSKVPHTSTGKQFLNSKQFMELSADTYISLIRATES